MRDQYKVLTEMYDKVKTEPLVIKDPKAEPAKPFVSGGKPKPDPWANWVPGMPKPKGIPEAGSAHTFTPERLAEIIRTNFETKTINGVQIMNHHSSTPMNLIEAYEHNGILYIDVESNDNA